MAWMSTSTASSSSSSSSSSIGSISCYLSSSSLPNAHSFSITDNLTSSTPTAPRLNHLTPTPHPSENTTDTNH
ncbi:hypothetical protein E2C01_033140 [Portunus trituberculatus]|uniref:Uncharacterized protein n=1 Tax=Portunus trituberculatus TaxID=210409 RepID=A0A5B7F2Z8_PORTR|nr:hypothetical protein [Portunus trituberculatus]